MLLKRNLFDINIFQEYFPRARPKADLSMKTAHLRIIFVICYALASTSQVYSQSKLEENFLKKVMRQTLPSESKCITGLAGPFCIYETNLTKLEILTTDDGGTVIQSKRAYPVDAQAHMM